MAAKFTIFTRRKAIGEMPDVVTSENIVKTSRCKSDKFQTVGDMEREKAGMCYTTQLVKPLSGTPVNQQTEWLIYCTTLPYMFSVHTYKIK